MRKFIEQLVSKMAVLGLFLTPVFIIGVIFVDSDFAWKLLLTNVTITSSLIVGYWIEFVEDKK